MKMSKGCDQVKAPVLFCCRFRQDQSFLPHQNLTPLHSNTPLQNSAPTGPDSSIGSVSAPGNGRSWVRSQAATYQSR